MKDFFGDRGSRCVRKELKLIATIHNRKNWILTGQNQNSRGGGGKIWILDGVDSRF